MMWTGRGPGRSSNAVLNLSVINKLVDLSIMSEILGYCMSYCIKHVIVTAQHTHRSTQWCKHDIHVQSGCRPKAKSSGQAVRWSGGQLVEWMVAQTVGQAGDKRS